MAQFVLTPGNDTVAAAGTSGNEVVAATGTLNAGDVIDAGNAATLTLTGTGAYDLAAVSVLTGVTTLKETASNETVTTRLGLPLAIIDSGTDDTTTLIDPNDQFTDTGGGNTVSVAGALLGSVGITGNGGTSLTITQPVGAIALDALTGISGLGYVSLADAGTTFDPGAAALNVIYVNATGDTVTLDDTSSAAIDYNGGNTIDFTATAALAPGQTELLTLNSATTGDTLVGFNASTQVLLGAVSNIYGQPVYDAVANTVTIHGVDAGGGDVRLTFGLIGAYADAFTLTDVPGQGFTLGYTGADPAGVAMLTRGDDNVGAGVTVVVATDGTLTSGDVLNPDFGATLELVGAGNFNLNAVADANGIAAVQIDATGAQFDDRVGLRADVTIKAGGDVVYLVNAGDTLAGGTTGNNFVLLGADSRGDTVDGGTGGGNTLGYIAPTLTGYTSYVDFAHFVVNSGSATDFQYAQLQGGAGATFDPSFYGFSTVYVQSAFDTVVMDQSDPVTIDDRSGNSIFFGKAADGAETLVLTNLGSAGNGFSTDTNYENLYNFQAGDKIVLGQFASGTVTYDPAGFLSVDGLSAGGAARHVSLELDGVGNPVTPGYAASGFHLVADTTGYAPGKLDLIYTGPAPTLAVLTTAQDAVSGLAAGTPIIVGPETLSGGDAIAGNGSELRTVSAGIFDLGAPATLSGISDVQIDGANEDVFARAGTPLSFAVNQMNENVHLKNFGDAVVGNSFESGLTVYASPDVVAAATITGGGGGHNTLQIETTAGNGESITLGSNVTGIQNINLGSNAVTFDTGNCGATARAPLQISINIGYAAPATTAPDTLFLRGAGEEVTDFYSGNVYYLYNRNQRLDLFGNGATGAATVNSFFPSDTIHLFEAPADATYSVAFNATHSVTTLVVHGTAADTSPFTYTLSLGGYLDRPFTLTQDTAQGGIDIRYDVTCFASGTRIATPDGARAVEDLAVGDRVTRADGGSAAIRWVGQRRFDIAAHPHPQRLRPIRIAAGAIAGGVPVRDLFVSPDHALRVDGHLIPARLLCNGATIAPVDCAHVTYHHIELAAHDVLLAEGLAAESYLDTGNRAMLDGTGPADFSVRARMAAPGEPCAPIVTDAGIVRPVWAALAARAGLVPCRPAAWTPDLRVDAAGRSLAVHRDGTRLTVAVPPGTGAIRLRTPTHQPSALEPWRDDRRSLGLAVRAIAVDGLGLALDGPALDEGWHLPEGGLRWTAGDARLRLPHGARMITVTLAG